jgi:hypothetical protein
MRHRHQSPTLSRASYHPQPFYFATMLPQQINKTKQHIEVSVISFIL